MIFKIFINLTSACATIVVKYLRLSGQFQACLFIYFFFYEKILNAQKHATSKKPTNKTKLSKQKATKATFFRTHKNSKRGKLFVLRFGAFFYY